MKVKVAKKSYNPHSIIIIVNDFILTKHHIEKSNGLRFSLTKHLTLNKDNYELSINNILHLYPVPFHFNFHCKTSENKFPAVSSVSLDLLHVRNPIRDGYFVPKSVVTVNRNRPIPTIDTSNNWYLCQIHISLILCSNTCLLYSLLRNFYNMNC